MERFKYGNAIVERLCCRDFYTNIWVRIATVLPTAGNAALLLASVMLDSAVACALAINYGLIGSSVAALCFIMLPSGATYIYKPPAPPDSTTFRQFYTWIFQIVANLVCYPLLVSLRLIKSSVRAASVASDINSLTDEVNNNCGDCLPKETHTYLFLQGYLHSAPQAILQMYILILGLTRDGFTVSLQIASVLTSVAVVALRTTLFHRYEAQVNGGRSAVLLTRSPPKCDSDAVPPLLPIQLCIKSKVISLEMDGQLGIVVAFLSWFCLIFGRILCLVISYKTHAGVLIVFLLAHFSLMLLYSLSSQSIKLVEVPSRLFNVTISLLALAEVSIRFNKVPLLYALFFISFFVEDTFLMVLFFVYPPKLCTPNTLDCKFFGLCSYLIINSHVIGTILFGIYLVKFRPHKKHDYSQT